MKGVRNSRLDRVFSMNVAPFIALPCQTRVG